MADFKFPQIYAYYISLDCILFGYNEYWTYFFLCIQQAKSSIKTILSKIFEQNVDQAKVDQFSTPTFKNDDVSRKVMTSSKKVCQIVDK